MSRTARLEVSEGVVKGSLRQAFHKLSVRTRAQLVKVAFCLLSAFSIIAFLILGELAMPSVAGFLNQAIGHQFVRAPQIPVPQIRDQERQGAPLI